MGVRDRANRNPYHLSFCIDFVENVSTVIMNTFRLSAALVAILLLSALFAGNAANLAAAQASTSDAPHTSADSNLVGTSVQASNMKHFIFRDDDVGPFANMNALKAVNQVHIDKNVPVTLGITAHPDPYSGNELLADKDMLSYLRSLVTNPLFEFAQHGYTHMDDTQSTVGAATPPQNIVGASPYRMVGTVPYQERLVGAPVYSEFRGRSYTVQYNAIQQGRHDITEALGVTPTTFIPPWNAGDQNTLKACAALGFTLYSTGWEDFSTFDAAIDGIHVQGAHFSIGWDTASEWRTGMAQLTSDTDNALNSASGGQNFMLFYHSWQFLTPDGSSVDPLRVSLFGQYIDHLKARGDVQFTTHNNENMLGRTQVLLNAPNTNPTVGQSVTFTATLTSGTTPLSSKSVTIYHYFNNVRYTDTTKTTDANGKITLTQSFGSAAQRSYYATFAGDGTYQTSTSSVVNVNVQAPTQTQTQVTLSPSTTTPAVGQSVTFTATLTSGTTPLSSKSVTIYHYFNNVRYTDTTKTTDANGKITLTQSFGSAAQRSYYATFAGDSSYASSTSSAVNINVGTSSRTTTLSLSPSTTTPAVGQSVTFTATLTSGTTALPSKSVTIYHYLNGVRYTDTTKTTNANGQITLTQSFGSAAQRPYYATFAGDSSYASSTSSVVTINVR